MSKLCKKLGPDGVVAGRPCALDRGHHGPCFYAPDSQGEGEHHLEFWLRWCSDWFIMPAGSEGPHIPWLLAMIYATPATGGDAPRWSIETERDDNGEICGPVVLLTGQGPAHRHEISGDGDGQDDATWVRFLVDTHNAALVASIGGDAPQGVTPEMIEAGARIVSGIGDQCIDNWDDRTDPSNTEDVRDEWRQVTRQILVAALAARPTGAQREESPTAWAARLPAEAYLGRAAWSVYTSYPDHLKKDLYEIKRLALPAPPQTGAPQELKGLRGLVRGVIQQIESHLDNVDPKTGDVAIHRDSLDAMVADCRDAVMREWGVPNAASQGETGS